MLGKVPTLGGLKSPPSQPCWLTRPKRLVFPRSGKHCLPCDLAPSQAVQVLEDLETIPHPRSVKRQWIEWTSSVKSYRVGGLLRIWCLPKPVSFAPVKNTGLEACLPVPAQPQKPYFILGNSSTHTKHFLTVLHKHTRVYPFFRIFLSYFFSFILSQTTS